MFCMRDANKNRHNVFLRHSIDFRLERLQMTSTFRTSNHLNLPVLDGSATTINGLCGNLLHLRDAIQLELLANS